MANRISVPDQPPALKAQSSSETGLQRKVDFLCNPKSYRGGLHAVEAKETHMSWVFLADGYAYKLKKPVRYDFLDFSTLEARRVSCEAELQLNRRLAPDVYLDVIPLTQDAAGRLHVGYGGEIVDWLVKMRRLPADGTLQDTIARQSVQKEDIHRLVAKLAAFYADAETVSIAARDYRQGIEQDVHNTHAELCRPLFQQQVDVVDDIAERLLSFLCQHGDLLEQRARSGKIVDGHGDLRPEHVYLGEKLLVIDCIEFKRDFRIVDPVDELSYLVMECERLGAEFMHEWIFPLYRELSNDKFDDALVTFYKAYRAYVRAKIAIWHLADDTVSDHVKWMTRCADYLRVAQRHLKTFSAVN
jgi:aminoglycoside phosphotransferase family enzyme